MYIEQLKYYIVPVSDFTKWSYFLIKQTFNLLF